MSVGLAILGVAGVTFLLWVLMGLMRESLGLGRRSAQTQEMVLYPLRKKREIVISIDSSRGTPGTRVTSMVAERKPEFPDTEDRATATGTK